MTTLREFGRLLKAAIKEKGLSLTAAAKAAGLALSSVNQWSLGYYAPAEEGFDALDKACGGFSDELKQAYLEISAPAKKHHEPRPLASTVVDKAPVNDHEKFCVMLAKARLAAGVTQTDLATAAGVTHSYGSKWERGVTLPSTKVWEKIKKAIPIPDELDEIYGRLGHSRSRSGLSTSHRSSWIRDERVALGMTQIQLAEATHLSHQTISSFENGKSDPSDVYIKRIRDAFKEARAAEPKKAVETKVIEPKQEEPMVKHEVTTDLEKLMSAPKQWMDRVAETAELLDPAVKGDVKDTLRGIAQMVKHLAMVLKSVPATSKAKGPEIKVEPVTEVKVEPRVEAEPERVIPELIRPCRGLSALTLDPESPLFPFRAEVPSIPFGTRLDSVRRESHYSEPDMARLIGMPAYDFWRIEHLEKIPNRFEAETICRAIGKSFEMMCPQLSDKVLSTQQLVDEIFKSGVTPDELAEMCDIPEEIVQQWYTHDRWPSFAYLQKMAEPFGLNINTVMNLMVRQRTN